ncbi:type II secretion system F family protein [Tundrisphaera sp. TA3]|uniref:type II secretion system F family protein n=1 Tax=Tundrisphaera sp. TA3 TaxID=3435775 RepID=UPI003EBB6784
MSRDDDQEPRPPRRPGPRPRPVEEAVGGGSSTFRPSPIPAGAARKKREERTPAPVTGGPNWFERIFYGQVSTAHLAMFCRQFASYQDSGVDLVRSLASMETQFARSALGPVIRRLRLAVSGGDPLSEAMANEPQAFDSLCLSMMTVAEARGGIPETLRRLANHYDARLRLIRQARSALIYPACVLAVAFGVVLLLAIFVLPKFADLLADMTRGGQANLPLPSRVLMGFSAFVTSHGWWSIPLATAVFLFAAFRWYRTSSGRATLDRLSLYVPVLGSLRRKIDTSRFARTLGSLLGAGVDIGSSLDLTARVLHLGPFREAVASMRSQVLHGAELSEALAATRQFGPDVIAIVGSGEESGRLPESLDKLADDYEDQVNYTVKNLGQLVQPVIVITMAGVVLFIILAIILPYIQIITSAAGGG